MARMKGSSDVTENAQTRLAALSSIDPGLDLGNGLSVAAYRTAAQEAQAKLDTYNILLSQVDDAHN
jgi:hypothetical protein